jgi:hypothetical protein
MGPPDINEVTFTQLTGMNQIGKNVMEVRGKRKFSNIEDCNKKIKIPRQYLEPLFFRLLNNIVILENFLIINNSVLFCN